MKYLEQNGEHVLELSELESNEHFAPYNPQDYELPSHLHNARHRFILESTYEWLVANVGEPKIAWSTGPTKIYDGDRKSLLFVDKSKAMLFKMTFHKGV